MAGPIRTKNLDVDAGSVLEVLRSEPFEFRFFQAVRLLERAMPGRAAVGRFADPALEAVRFLHHPSLAFPASEIQNLDWTEGRAARMMVNFLGLIGPLGVLPLHYTEFAIERLRARDHAFVEFLNIFLHRVTSVFYRAWEKHRFAIGYERDRQDPLTGCLYSLVGLGTAGLRGRQPFDDETLAFYGGFFGLIARSSLALESMLADYFDVPVSVEQFIGTWRRLDETDQCQFDLEFSGSTQLGSGAVVGDEVWDRQSRARIVLGPLSAGQYREFLPDGGAFKPLRSITRMFSGEDIEYELQLILKRGEVPGCELGSDDQAAVQLGWFTWMKSKATFDRDPGDTVLLLT
jgi:type VI secretion system protein ImpH